VFLGHEEDLTIPGKSSAAGLLVQRRPLRRCRAGMSSLYIVRGGRLAVGFRHIYNMAIALQVGETRLHNNAPGPISSL